MTTEQIREADNAIGCLNEARKHLDRAMYGMGIVEDTDPTYIKMRAFYDAICRALDIV